MTLAPADTRTLYDDDHELFRRTVRSFVERDVLPNIRAWETRKQVDRDFYRRAAEAGLTGFGIPAEFGGLDVEDFRFNAIVGEEFSRALVPAAGMGLALQNDIVLPYLTELTNAEQRARWLPGVARGESVLAVAMTEPGTGSDLSGIRTTAELVGDHYVVNGAKTFISSGQLADLVVTAVRTGPHPHKGLTLLVLERGMPGFERGRNLDKIGLAAQDTSELFFRDVKVPVANRLGEEGAGFAGLVRNLPQERLAIAITGIGASEGIFASTLEYVKSRKAFGQPIAAFQNSRFLLAELATEIEVAKTFVNDCLALHVRGELTAVRAAQAKYVATELQCRVADRCVQLHGGYGYMLEYPVARAYLDTRIQTIYGGTTEIMKEIVGRSLGI